MKDVDSFNQSAFEAVHQSGEQVTSIRVNPFKNFSPSAVKEIGTSIINLSLVPWSEFGYYLDKRPSFTFDPLFHAGSYYVQEASSMFLEQAIKQTVDLSMPLRVLDLCAAPGGKSTHIQSLMNENSILVSNEVIRARMGILKDNIIKWGCSNVIVTHNDPEDFSSLKNYFDLVVVDAPCSGSGLFRRDPEAVNEWSENNVQLCSKRQQRILADIWPSLKEDGILIYSTCSYAKEEDEQIAEWLLQSFAAEYRPLNIGKEWGMVASGVGYRFWPDKLKGEGFYLACFKKKQEEQEISFRPKKKIDLATKAETAIIEKWFANDGHIFVKNDNTVYAWPEMFFETYKLFINQLRVTYSGILAGELVRDKMVPAHSLALSNSVAVAIPRKELNYEDAIKYLQRKNIEINFDQKGWQLVTYKKNILGWVNVLPGRINNYYPKELRIIKDN